MKLLPAQIFERETLQKSMTSEGNSALLPANVDRRPPLQRGLMNFRLYHLRLVPQETVNFVSLESQCFPWLRLGKH